MKIKFKVFLVALILMLVDYSFSNAQPPPPYPCNPGIVCAGGCKPNGFDCWDIDDPVPLDNGLLLLAGAALTFGLYKLSRRRQSEVY